MALTVMYLLWVPTVPLRVPNPILPVGTFCTVLYMSVNVWTHPEEYTTVTAPLVVVIHTIVGDTDVVLWRVGTAVAVVKVKS